MEIQTGGGVLGLGNPDGRGGLAVLEIRVEGGVKKGWYPSGGGVWIFSGITHFHNVCSDFSITQTIP